MALYFPNFRARAGAARLGASRGRVFLPVALYFPNFRARAGATRLGASRGRAFLSAVFRPPYTADAALGFMRHLGQLSWPRPLGRNRRGLNMPLRHVQHRSRTKVRFAPLLSQSARLKPMLADIFFANASLPLTSAPERAPTCPKPYRATKNARSDAGILFYCLRSSRKNTLDASA